MRLLWLPEVLRAAGLTVHEVSGWRTRGSESWGPIRGITIHETRGSRTSTDAGEIGVLVDGRPGLSGPIAQLYLSRTGAWHVVASGRANHNKIGWAGPNRGLGNSHLIGIEAQHAAGEPWTDVQYESYVTGVAALVRRLGIPVSRVAGHYEHQPGEKTDPAFSMNQFRGDVARAMKGDRMTPEQESKILKGKLTSDNALFAWLRGIASGTMPTQTANGVDWSRMVTAPFPGLAQLGERLARVEQVIERIGERQPAELDYDRLAEALLRRIARQG